MRAVVINSPGGPEVLSVREIEPAARGPGEALVEVRATGLNRADLLQRRGLYPPPPGVRADVPGLEAAGVVLEADSSGGFRPGDRVMALLAGGGYAERVAVPAGHLLPIPERLSFEEAAAIPEAFLTAWDALFPGCGLVAGETVLVHACGSGVGTAAVQLAARAGARVLGTAGSAEKLSRAKPLGLAAGANRHEEDFVEMVRRETGGRGVDVLLDVVGGAWFGRNVEALAPCGRMILVGTLGGRRAEADLSAIMRKRATIRGTVLRPRSNAEKAELVRAFGRDVLPDFAAGRLRPVVARTLPLESAAEAHRLLESAAAFGKIVLTVS